MFCERTRAASQPHCEIEKVRSTSTVYSSAVLFSCAGRGISPFYDVSRMSVARRPLPQLSPEPVPPPSIHNICYNCFAPSRKLSVIWSDSRQTEVAAFRPVNARLVLTVTSRPQSRFILCCMFLFSCNILLYRCFFFFFKYFNVSQIN